MFNSSKKCLNFGLDTALVFSATEENLQSDLVGLKASYLYAEDIQLASARLYYTLFLMQEYERTELFKEILQRCLDSSVAKRRLDGIKRSEKELRRYLGHLMDAARPDGIKQEEPGVRMVNILPPDKESISAVIELAEGLDKEAFSILSYDDVVEKSLDFMYGNVLALEVIPVVDQDTLDQLDGFTRLTLGGPNPGIPGPLADPDDRSQAYKAWAANAILGTMPKFPGANWNTLSRVRDQLKDVRKTFLSAMNDLSQDFGAGGTPNKMAEFVSMNRLKIEANLEEIERELKAERTTSRLVGAGLPQLFLGIGLAVAGLMEHPLPYLTTFASGAGGVTAALAAQQLAKEAETRRKLKSQAKSHPYWLLYRASEFGGAPIWPSKSAKPTRHPSC